METTRESLNNALRVWVPTGRITCAQAMALAKRHEVPPIMIGQTADQLGIKITGCQLGCFGGNKER